MAVESGLVELDLRVHRYKLVGPEREGFGGVYYASSLKGAASTMDLFMTRGERMRAKGWEVEVLGVGVKFSTLELLHMIPKRTVLEVEEERLA